MNTERYIRQLTLPEFTATDQKRFQETHIAVIGAGGLGCAALPYLAAAGIGQITIFDHDAISTSNLHRQTLYKDAETGQNKAEQAATYIRDLNPDIKVTAINKKLCHPETLALNNDIDLILDGSDNFETKTLLNDISIKTKTPLISASVNQWAGQIGIFAGYTQNKPCYHCLFPELPTDARNCNEAGILGTSAGITGLYQAHLALCFLANLQGFEPGRILSFDFKSLRMQNLTLNKDQSCPHCKNGQEEWKQKEKKMTELISMAELSQKDHIIVDVRTDAEIANDPIPAPPEKIIHMEVSTLPAHHEELPKGKLLAFVCAGNVRSVQAAEYLEALGYENVCVLDKFSV